MYYNDNGHYPKCPVSKHFLDRSAGTDSICPSGYAGSALQNSGYLQRIPIDPLYGDDGDEDWGSDYQYRSFNSGQAYMLRTAFEGTLERTHDYPNGSTCTSGNPVCDWSEPDCVYVTGSSCELYWLQTNSGE